MRTALIFSSDKKKPNLSPSLSTNPITLSTFPRTSNVTLYPARNGYPSPQLRNENASSNYGASSSDGVVSFCRRATRKNTRENSKSDLTQPALPQSYFHPTFPWKLNWVPCMHDHGTNSNQLLVFWFLSLNLVLLRRNDTCIIPVCIILKAQVKNLFSHLRPLIFF